MTGPYNTASAIAIMLNTAAHFRKIGNYEAAHRAIATLKSWH